MKSITLSKTELTSSVLKQYRLELLKYHVELVELFNKYYIVNYNPQRPYRMHMFPPVDAVDGLVFGEVDLSRIRDNMNQISRRI